MEMLMHFDRHFVSNMISLLTSGYLLDLGFVKSSLLFFGGGLAGAVTQILEHTWLKDRRPLNRHWKLLDRADRGLDSIRSYWPWEPPLLNQVSRLKSQFPMQMTACGASAAVNAFVGAETIHLSYALSQSLKRLKRYKKHSAEWTSQLHHVSHLFCLLSGRTLCLLVELWLSTKNDLSPVGHSAHVGGFLFGALLMAWWKN
jgi:hypothetical protein